MIENRIKGISYKLKGIFGIRHKLKYLYAFREFTNKFAAILSS